MNPFNKIKADIQLYLLVFGMSFFIIGIGWYGIRELKAINQNIQTLYSDRVFPIQQLTTVRFSYTEGILSTIQQVKIGQITYRDAGRRIEEAKKSITANWRAYKLTYLTEEESQRVKEAEMLMERANKTVEKLKTILELEDVLALDEMINRSLYPTIHPAISKINELIELQVRVGGDINKNSVEMYEVASRKFFLLIILSLAFAIPFSFYLIRNVKNLIKNLRVKNIKITEGEKKYRSLMEHAGDPIFLLNFDTSFNEVNTSTCKLLGYTHEELMEMKVTDVLNQEEIRKRPLQLEYATSHEVLMSERKLKRKDGTELNVEVNVKLLEGKGYLCIARDITERKQMEATLKESEQRYRNIFENVQDVFYQTNLEGTILDVSPSVKDHLGYCREELIGTNVSTIYYDLEDRNKGIDLINKNGEFRDHELRFKSSFGTDVFISLNARLIKGDDGKLSHIDGAFRNITERKRMLAQLVENKAQLTLFIEHSPASLAMFDNEMRYITTSRRWISDYNLGSQQLEGKTHYEIFPEIPKHWKEIHQRCLNGAIEKSEEDMFIRADGSKEWLRWEIHPWHKASKEIGGIIMFTEVITDRKRATELFKYQFDNSPDIILIINRDFKIESMNRGLPGGLPVQDLIGVDSITILPPESQETVKAAILKCFETGQNQEIESILRFGNWSRSRFVPIVSNGSISHIMVNINGYNAT